MTNNHNGSHEHENHHSDAIPSSSPTPTAQGYAPPFAASTPPYQPPVYATHQETDILGILSLVFAVLFAPVGLVLGIVGMVQAKKTIYPTPYP